VSPTPGSPPSPPEEAGFVVAKIKTCVGVCSGWLHADEEGSSDRPVATAPDIRSAPRFSTRCEDPAVG